MGELQVMKAKLEFSDKGLAIEGERICPLMTIRILKIRDNKLIIMGMHRFDNIGEFDCYFVDDKCRRYELNFTEAVEKELDTPQKMVILERGFEVEIEIGNIKSLRFAAEKSSEGDADIPDPYYTRLSFGQKGKISKQIESSYYARDGYIIWRKYRSLKIAKTSLPKIITRELIVGKEMISSGRGVKPALIRIAALLKKALNKRPVWIVSDRNNAAGDNGEALFKYIVKYEKEANVFFTIEGDSPDFKRLESIGKVLKLGTLKYKLMFLTASKIISSQTGDWVTNAFADEVELYKGMYDFDTYFLQHGVIMTDLSSWFRGYNKDLNLIVTTAKREYESLIDYGFNCTEKVVKLTGLPRFDYLESEPQKNIVFLPTWRRNISGEIITGTAQMEHSDTFKKSEYCRFYNSLINNQRLLDSMKENGYSGQMYLHPAITAQADDFKGNDIIKVIAERADYKKVFKESSLVITDYSSAIVDFAYLKKPIVYTQFDHDEFFSEHHCRPGYFDYERDGFGPVAYDEEATADIIIKYIASGCEMEPKYILRVEDFFAFWDRNNCKRVYEEIKKS